MPANTEFAVIDRHLFRVAHGSLLDSPLDPDRGARTWVATIWEDRQAVGGWARLMWNRHPSGRGWTIHELTHLGDIVEFGADTADGPDRWYGYVHEADPTSLTLVGPFDTPTNATEDAQVFVARWRQDH